MKPTVLTIALLIKSIRSARAISDSIHPVKRNASDASIQVRPKISCLASADRLWRLKGSWRVVAASVISVVVRSGSSVFSVGSWECPYWIRVDQRSFIPRALVIS